MDCRGSEGEGGGEGEREGKGEERGGRGRETESSGERGQRQFGQLSRNDAGTERGVFEQ